MYWESTVVEDQFRLSHININLSLAPAEEEEPPRKEEPEEEELEEEEEE